MLRKQGVLLALGALGALCLVLALCQCGTAPTREPATATHTPHRPSPPATTAAPPKTPTRTTRTPPASATPTERQATVALPPTAAPAPTSTPSPLPSPSPAPIFGVEMKQIGEDRGLSLGQAAGVHWLRHNGLLWAKVEPDPGERRWRAVSDLEAGLEAAYEAGLKTILIVRQTPGWAQEIEGHSCGAITPEALDDFAAFMTDAVLRYKDPPYGVKYWELWNEPDVDPFLVKPNSVFGCWGDQDDVFYGGATYARMLQAVYPAIKAADPEARVLLGGLLLDADPAKDEHANPPAKFLEGILQAGGGGFFDIVSFHGYTWYDGQFGEWELLNPKWSARGGIVAGKVDFLREVLDTYGVEKPLMLTEAGLLCIDCTDPPPIGFLQAQAAYVPRLYTRSMALDLQATIWYTLDGPGWRQTALLDGEQNPRPAYEAFHTMTLMLQDARHLRPIKEFEGLTGHAFETAKGEMWVLWSPSGAPIEIPAPSGLQDAYDLAGVPLGMEDETLTVGYQPIYLAVSPP